MKRTVSLVLTIILTLVYSSYVLAAPTAKTVDVVSTASATKVNVGETVNLTATTLKCGSSFVDSWSGAAGSTVFNNETGYYESKAAFSSMTPGVYTITYDITMTAGKSAVTFVGKATQVIEVVQPATVVGVEVTNIAVTPVYNPNQNLTGYDATGDVLIVWSNNTKTYYGVTDFKFSPNQITRNIDVTINAAGTSYTYTVKVSR